MGNKLSCLGTSDGDGQQTKTAKDPRPNDYTEIDDDFMTSEKSTSSNGGDFASAGNTNNLADSVDVKDKIALTPSVAVTAANGKKKPHKANRKGDAGGGGGGGGVKYSANGKKNKQALTPTTSGYSQQNKSAVVSEMESPTAMYQNLPVFSNSQQQQQTMTTTTRAMTPRIQEEKVAGVDVCLYTKVDKAKPKAKPKMKMAKTGGTQLNYIEVEFPSSPSKKPEEEKETRDEGETTYTDVIHKDGKIVLVN